MKPEDLWVHITAGDDGAERAPDGFPGADSGGYQSARDLSPQGGKEPGDNQWQICLHYKDKIFLPFFTTKDRGTGLGLSLVQKIIVSHGGTIFVDSSDRGATFRIRLPLKY